MIPSTGSFGPKSSQAITYTLGKCFCSEPTTNMRLTLYQLQGQAGSSRRIDGPRMPMRSKGPICRRWKTSGMNPVKGAGIELNTHHLGRRNRLPSPNEGTSAGFADTHEYTDNGAFPGDVARD